MTGEPDLVSASVLVGFGAALWFGLWYGHGPGSLLASVVKTVAVAALALAALAGAAPALLTLGLGLSALGDLALSRPGERPFLAGLAAFGLAHLAYIVLFMLQPDWALPPALPAAGLLLACLAMAVFLWPHAGALRAPVLTYAALISLMGLAALGQPRTAGALAAVMFILSDAILAVQIFRPTTGWARWRATPRLAWGLYWGAQALFLQVFLGAPPV
jgi:uncharacterized membrane protein YhhN